MQFKSLHFIAYMFLRIISCSALGFDSGSGLAPNIYWVLVLALLGHWVPAE